MKIRSARRKDPCRPGKMQQWWNKFQGETKNFPHAFWEKCETIDTAIYGTCFPDVLIPHPNLSGHAHTSSVRQRRWIRSANSCCRHNEMIINATPDPFVVASLQVSTQNEGQKRKKKLKKQQTKQKQKTKQQQKSAHQRWSRALDWASRPVLGGGGCTGFLSSHCNLAESCTCTQRHSCCAHPKSAANSVWCERGGGRFRVQ